MRWFRNKFPAVEPQGEPLIRTDNAFYTFGANYGIHEIIVETPRHDEQLADLTPARISTLLTVYLERLKLVSQEPHIEYVTVFKNHGPQAGTSVYHSHSQIISLNFIPPFIRELHHKSHSEGKCQFCDVIESERASSRLVLDTPHAIAFTPYASQFGFEAWVFPKKHTDSPLTLSPGECFDLAQCMKKVLTGLSLLNASYNIALVYGTPSLPIHPHFRIYPRIGIWGGFELGSRVIINGVLPEVAASFYRDPHAQ